MDFNPWRRMLAELWHWGGEPALAEWMLASKPGDTMVVLCDSGTEKGNVQSRVNQVCKRKGIRAQSKRTKQGVLVVRL